MKRYHPLLVSLHWIIAFMIFLALVVGGPMMADIDSASPDKMGALGGHMIWGMVVGILIIIRLVTRQTTQKPPKADAKNGMLNTGAQLAHWGLYILPLAMVASGLATALSAGLFDIVYGGNGVPIPLDLAEYAPRIAHGFIAYLLLALIILHLLGAIYHQFLLRDGLLSRMWFGKRKGD